MQRSLKRTKAELYAAMEGDGSQNPEVARRLFQEANGPANGGSGGFIGPVFNPAYDDSL